MKELDEMIEKQVVVETVGKKETSGILTSVKTLGIYTRELIYHQYRQRNIRPYAICL